jgi:YihY family inner membrane protein
MSSARETLSEETSKAKRAANRLDDFQQRHPAFGFPIAVWRKFGEDQAGNLAALIAYWAFFSIFPLLLVAVTVVGIVGVGQGTFQDVMQQFPLVGENLQGLSGNWWGLVFGIGTALWSGLAVVKATQSAFDAVWEVPMRERPSFLTKILTGVRALVVVGIGVIVSLGLSGIATGGKKIHVSWPIWLRIVDGAVTIALNVGLLSLAYAWLTKRDLRIRQMLPGAIFAGVILFGLELGAGALITHAAAGQKNAAGTVSVVLGMLWFFALAGQVVLYGAEINVVRVEKLWPRGLVDAPDTRADHRAYEAYAQEKTYRPNQSVQTHFSDELSESEREAGTGGWRRDRQ